VSTGKKVFVPNLFSFLGSVHCCLRVRSVRHYSNPSFRRIDSGARTAVRSVTHLVLARAAGILFFLKASPSFGLAAPNPLLAGPENFQFRSAFIQFETWWFADLGPRPTRF
jgi:hypothetical protein